MGKAAAILFLLATLVTLGSLGAWLATGRHVFTKYQVAVEAEKDPLLAGTGFYDDQTDGGVVRMKEEFHFGLLPAGLFGRDALALLSVSGPAWAAVLAVLLLVRRCNCKERTDSCGTD
jgi:hypothetical protein